MGTFFSLCGDLEEKAGPANSEKCRWMPRQLVVKQAKDHSLQYIKLYAVFLTAPFVPKNFPIAPTLS
jgi:hypothetical protein